MIFDQLPHCENNTARRRPISSLHLCFPFGVLGLEDKLPAIASVIPTEGPNDIVTGLSNHRNVVTIAPTSRCPAIFQGRLSARHEIGNMQSENWRRSKHQPRPKSKAAGDPRIIVWTSLCSYGEDAAHTVPTGALSITWHLFGEVSCKQARSHELP